MTQCYIILVLPILCCINPNRCLLSLYIISIDRNKYSYEVPHRNGYSGYVMVYMNIDREGLDYESRSMRVYNLIVNPSL